MSLSPSIRARAAATTSASARSVSAPAAPSARRRVARARREGQPRRARPPAPARSLSRSRPGPRARRRASGPLRRTRPARAPEGSTPRSTVTLRTACAIAASTTATTPAALTPARSSAACAASTSRTPMPGSGAPCGDVPEHEVGIGHGRLVTTSPVARRARIGTGRAWPDSKRAPAVDPRDRTAAGADGVDVERRQAHREAADLAGGRGAGHAAGDEAHVGRRAAHVEAHCVGPAVRRARRRPRPARPPRVRTATATAGRSVACASGTSPPADVITRTSGARSRSRPQIGAARRLHVRVDNGGHEALVLAVLGRDLVRRQPRRCLAGRAPRATRSS